MKNREHVLRELEKIESITSELNFIIKHQQPIESYMAMIEKLRNCIEQTKLYVNSEPIGY